MATINASVTISSDISSNPISISKTMSMTKSANPSVGLEETTGLRTKRFTNTTAAVIVEADELTADKAHKLYLKNTSTTATEFFLITVNAEDVGRLYAGDWALIPWSAHDNDCDIKIDPSANDMTLEYMLFTDG